MTTVAYSAQAGATYNYGTEQDYEQQTAGEEYISTFFCRALYDYEPGDASSLAFRKGDIIEVLTQLESGWWDGLLGEERGWFPSNYVTPISDQEAEAAFNASEVSDSQPASLADDSMVDMAHSMSRLLSQSERSDGDWINDDAEYSSHLPHANGYANGVNGKSAKHNDFWVPQVSQDGRIFYVNTQTGQHSRDLPQETEEDPDGDLAGLTTQVQSSRTGAGVGLGLAAVNGLDQEQATTADFGIPKRSRTPEPWVKRLADDGMSYYYVNKLNGQISWTAPVVTVAESSAQSASGLSSRNDSFSSREMALSGGRVRADSSASAAGDRSDSNADRISINSQDSDVFPMRDRSTSSANQLKSANGSARPLPPYGHVNLTQSEQLAQALQQELSPPLPESPVDLSNRVREAIATIMELLQSSPLPRRPEQLQEVDQQVLQIVSAVRNLLYVTATPSGHIPSNLYPRDNREVRATNAGQSLQSHLKAAQRKVAGTLSKLVLSALAMQYDPGLSNGDRPNRMESDVAELERAVVAFVTEVHFYQEQNSVPQAKQATKRLHGVFSPVNIGTGLPGAGAAGSWKGFGYVPLDDTTPPPLQNFGQEQIKEVNVATQALGDKLSLITTALRHPEWDVERIKKDCQTIVPQLTSILDYICNIDIARHVDADGIRGDLKRTSMHSREYIQTVEKAALLMRHLEIALQSLYDDGTTILITSQGLGLDDVRDVDSQRDHLDSHVAAIVSNTSVAVQTLDALLAVGYDQADISQEERSTMHGHDAEEEIVGFEDVLSGLGTRPVKPPHAPAPLYQSQSQTSSSSSSSSPVVTRSRSGSVADAVTSTWTPVGPSEPSTLVLSASSEGEHADGLAEEGEDEPTSTQSASGKIIKLKKMLGDEAPSHIIDRYNADAKPWYLRPNYDPADILMDPDGAVRAGTSAALVERLTAHDHGDTTFNQNFLLTFKSFMTVDDLFDLLVRRFMIPVPANLSPSEFVDWTDHKQKIVRARVLNTMRNMVMDDGILEKDDMYILERMKEFASNEELANFAAARQLLILIERALSGGDAAVKMSTVPHAPPAPILPKTTRKLKLLDIHPEEIARQLTLMEASMYKKIRPLECLLRSRETKRGQNKDNFSIIIELSNRIAYWVADSILEREDSRRRAVVLKHFISIADRCRTMQNYSTMTAIVSGLATQPIRRLKRTWEQVNSRHLSQLRMCESTIDHTKNFNNYRQLLARISPPCVPFIGLYLTTLTFINDGAEDKVGGHMINFRKRQKAAEVIQDIKRWQSMPYNLQTVASILSFLEECFSKYSDNVDYGDQFWNLSLEREPREREDEKMARLLQESGFL